MADFNLLLQNVLEYGRSQEWRYVELRGERLLCQEIPYKRFVQHTLPLIKDENVLKAQVRKSAARNIQKAVKEGVKIDVTYDLSGVLSFYRLHCLTRRRQGQPPQAKQYFINLHKYLIDDGLGFTALARHGQSIIAGLICLHYGSNAIYKYGASDEKYQNLRANNLLFWEMIKKCAYDGFSTLSFGRTDLQNTGLMVFKDGWGGERSELNYYRYDLAKDAFISRTNNLQGYEALFKKLPVAILRLLGAVGYRHMG
ncbi:GNAT family N-acetyltransferase [Geomonas azotofigens]|uniref:GNAT family N-acetyltransferase n=1 Tax=Geomonas azotofigens TaxID=2843196 RepID=UPI002E28BDDD|nr:GNAT family N-acetyltransferase [Geomonas azotofigens]